MKKRVMIAASAALLANSFLTSPGITAVTLIDTVSPEGPNPTTMASMEAQCDAKATARPGLERRSGREQHRCNVR
jgi:hypothetical protein